MDISTRDIEWAAARGVISSSQVDPLWSALEGRTRAGSVTHVAPERFEPALSSVRSWGWS